MPCSPSTSRATGTGRFHSSSNEVSSYRNTGSCLHQISKELSITTRCSCNHRRTCVVGYVHNGVFDAFCQDSVRLDGAFPFEVPTIQCEICQDSFSYDDIFVFGCDKSHKACYECFEGSCTSKMNNNEVLTCPMCPYQLTEGEVKHMRVSPERRQELLDYQIQKTFATYAGSQQGVIRCPYKKCTWVAEMCNPNERFQVTCRMCAHEFCSLCSQQYHYRTTCEQVREYTQRWYFWCNTGRVLRRNDSHGISIGFFL